jgi:hypothetical protein
MCEISSFNEIVVTLMPSKIKNQQNIESKEHLQKTD